MESDSGVSGATGCVSQKLQQHLWPSSRFIRPRLTRRLSRRSAPAVQIQELHTGQLEAHPSYNLFLSGACDGWIVFMSLHQHNLSVRASHLCAVVFVVVVECATILQSLL